MGALQSEIIIVICLVESIILHEMAHGFAALLFGDPTAKRLGRITFNPIPHIDPVWTIAVPLAAYFLSGGTFIIGGAKPVPVNRMHFRRPLLGDICVSIAGVAVNFLIAIGMILLLNLIYFDYGNSSAMQIAHILRKVALLNILLALFNLIPIPPLDGSHLFKYLLPVKMRRSYENLGRTGAGFIIMIVIINIPMLWNTFSEMIIGLDRFLLKKLIFF